MVNIYSTVNGWRADELLRLLPAATHHTKADEPDGLGVWEKVPRTIQVKLPTGDRDPAPFTLKLPGAAWEALRRAVLKEYFA